jgi:hypothetical protein
VEQAQRGATRSVEVPAQDRPAGRVRDPTEALTLRRSSARAWLTFRGDSALYVVVPDCDQYSRRIISSRATAAGRLRSDLQTRCYDVQVRLKDTDTPEGLLLTNQIRTPEKAISQLPR